MLTRRLGDRVRAATAWGIGYAVVLSLWAVFVALSGGLRRYAQYGLTLPVVISIYVLAGLAGGVLVGVFLPLLRTHVGAFLLGMIGLAPAYGLSALFIAGVWPPTWYHLIAFVGLPLVVGGPVGLVYRHLFWPEAVADERRHRHQIRKEAEQAMRARDYARAVQVYRSFKGHLTWNDKRRLAEAERRLGLAP